MSFVGLKNENGGVRRGSALVLVIVLTVLLSSVGILFVMMSRLDEMATSSIIRNAELDAGVDAVVGKIEKLLLAGAGNNSVRPGNTTWLSSVEPVLVSYDVDNPYEYSDYIFEWPYISDIYGSIPGFGLYDPLDRSKPEQWDGSVASDEYWIPGGRRNIPARVIEEGEAVQAIIEAGDWAEPLDVTLWGARADADGDGVADSRWVLVPDISGGKGEEIYAAVRVVDSNAKLNLNVAHSLGDDPNLYGAYLSHVDYEGFLRGADRYDVSNDPRDISNVVDNIRAARMASWMYDPAVDTPAKYHNEALMNIENPGGLYNLFDVGDELEVTNRFILSSKVEARFEQADVLNLTLDAGGGTYGTLSIPRDSADTFDKWKWRMDDRNFSVGPEDTVDPGVDPNCPQPYKYDRRHVCTFYSFDKVWREPYTNEDILNPSAWFVEPDPGAGVDGVRLGDVFMPWRGAVSVRDLAMVYPDDAGFTPEEKQERQDAVKQLRKTVLHLLYAFRAYYLDQGEIPADAAKMAAQYVVNMIDYIDGGQPDDEWEGPFGDPVYGDGTDGQANADPTFIDHEVIRQLIIEVSTDVSKEMLGAGNEFEIDIDSGDAEDEQYALGLEDGVIVYGYERQPFISEIASEIDAFGGKVMVAIELANPYDADLDLTGWRIKMDSKKFAAFGANTVVVPKGDSAEPDKLGHFVIGSTATLPTGAVGEYYQLTGLENELLGTRTIELQRPDPADAAKFITVDWTDKDQTTHLLTNSQNTYSSKRDDRQWKFTDAKNFENDNASNLGAENGLSGPEPTKWQMPVADDSDMVLMTLGDFEKVLSIGTERANSTVPNSTDIPVTKFIADAAAAADVRFDIETSDLLDYVCLLSRAEGNLPGRININTATKEVIRAAIPPSASGLWDADKLAKAIVDGRPYGSLGDLLDVAEFTAFKGESPQIDLAGDDAAVEDDFEERDWILSRVSNIFTVRSDVFVAYILVRLGEDGPEKRVMAIFDRSNVHWPTDKPRVVAIHPVPDPR